jgi:glycerol kinase
MRRLIVAIDQGTTGTTVLVLDASLTVVGRAYAEFRQIYPQPGWVEHDPEDIWATVGQTVPAALEDAGARPEEVAGIGITNQRETTVLWERSNGKPVHNAIVWQCRRTAQVCAALKKEGLEPLFRERTGLVLDPYFSGTKLRWLLNNVNGARARAEQGELAFGTIDTFLVNRLTGGVAHVTDVSNASRTLLLNLETLAWDEELARLLNVPMSVLPRVASCSEVYGSTRGLSFLPDGVPVAGMAGDQQAALFGQVCFEEGEAKCTYGTGAFLLMNTGARPVPSKNGLLTTVGWRVGDEVRYALEGSSFIAGAAVQWLRDELKILGSASEVEALARQVEDSGGVVLVPAFAGLGAPHWDADARAAVLGMTRGTGRPHLARATLNGIACQIADLVAAMEQDLGKPLSRMKVDGGAARNDLLMQIQADLLERTVIRPRLIETTAIGAALLAGLAVGVWTDQRDVLSSWQEEGVFEARMDTPARAALMDRWHAAVDAVKGFGS